MLFVDVVEILRREEVDSHRFGRGATIYLPDSGDDVCIVLRAGRQGTHARQRVSPDRRSGGATVARSRAESSKKCSFGSDSMCYPAASECLLLLIRSAGPVDLQGIGDLGKDNMKAADSSSSR